jgi:23S rRNA pseudouridine2605 synthase
MRSEQQRKVGLARTLSKLGYCSRARGFELVRSGRVAVSGKIQRNPEYPVTFSDVVTVEGRLVTTSDRLYLMMNKPRGLVTTASDEKGRPTVYSLLGPELPWVAPVGRLDQASEGLLLFTNDSEWAGQITSPGSHIEKTYRVQIGSVAGTALTRKLCDGIVERGENLRAIHASVLRSSQKTSWLDVTLDEGRNRQIRRMLAAEGLEVLRLIRIGIGPLALGDLAKGHVRQLSKAEKKSLDLR